MRYAVLILICTLLSCHNSNAQKTNAQKSTTEKKTVKAQNLSNKTITYLSGENDSASIKLTIIPDGSFSFVMNILGENDTINSIGNWKENANTITLIFDDDENLNLSALFNSKNDECKVTGKHTIEFEQNLYKLSIWGVSCFRID